jgi:predicted nucleic-acid-binding Zn-ribbon protein
VNLTDARCRRCDGQRFFHVRAMRDAQMEMENGTLKLGWRERPVRLAAAEPNAAVSHPFGSFETLVCRRCGYTGWYTLGWQIGNEATTPRPCSDCHATTQHVLLPAIEYGGSSFENARITHGLLGREGFLCLSICTACDRADWSGRDYQHLEPRHFVRYRMAHESERPCLSCQATDAIVDDEVREYEGMDIPIALENAGVLYRLFGVQRTVGHFQLRLCRPCGAVEWYAQKLDRIRIGHADGVYELDTAPAVSSGGPYR